MNSSRMNRLAAAAFALVTLVNADAFAQAEYTPTLTVTTTGNSVDIRWTAISLAPSYDLVAGSTSGSSDIANVTVPAALLGAAPRIVVTAPQAWEPFRRRSLLVTHRLERKVQPDQRRLRPNLDEIIQPLRVQQIHALAKPHALPQVT